MKQDLNNKGDIHSEIVTEIKPFITSVYTGDQTNQITFTVPEKKTWVMKWIGATFVTSSDQILENRSIIVEVLDKSLNSIFKIKAPVQSGSESYDYLFSAKLEHLKITSSNQILCPLPPELFLKPNWKLKIYDENLVSINDDLQVTFQANEYMAL